MKTEGKYFEISILIFVMLMSLPTPMVLLVKSQPQGYTLVYSSPPAYDTSWVDVKTVYMKTDGNMLYFYIEYYGAIPRSRDHERLPTIYMDTDRNSKTGMSSHGLGLDYYISLETYGDNSGFWIGLYKWNSTSSSWKNLRTSNEVDLKLGATRAPGLSYVEVWVDQQDVSYTPQGIDFYIYAWSRITSMPDTDLGYVVGSTVRQIKVDGEPGEWGTVSPLKTLTSRSINPPELEPSSIYVANDAENLYVRIDTMGTLTKAVKDGELQRGFFAYLDVDNDDKTGCQGLSGAEYYIATWFIANSSGKSTFVDLYKYAGTGYQWSRVSQLPSSSDFNSVFEFKIPLSTLGIGSGKQIGLYVRGRGHFIRDTPRLTYPQIDTTPPVTTVTINAPKNLIGMATYVSGLTLLELSASDDASGVKETKYRVDGGHWNTYTSAFTLSSYSDGEHTINYYSVDMAGNKEAEKTLTVVLDRAPPVISNAWPTGSVILLYAPASVTFRAVVEDTGSGVKEVTLTLDGVSQGAMSRDGDTYTKTVSLSEGTHAWTVEAADNVNNTAIQNNTFSAVSLLIWILATVALVIMLLVVLLLRRKKTLPPPPPPE